MRFDGARGDFLASYDMICATAPSGASGAKFRAPPGGRRGSDRALELAAEMIDVAEPAELGDLRKRLVLSAISACAWISRSRISHWRGLVRRCLRNSRLICDGLTRSAPRDRRRSRAGRDRRAWRTWPRSGLRERARAPRPMAPVDHGQELGDELVEPQVQPGVAAAHRGNSRSNQAARRRRQ